MATEQKGHSPQLKDTDESNSSSPKPRLTRIRSLISQQSTSQGERRREPPISGSLEEILRYKRPTLKSSTLTDSQSGGPKGAVSLSKQPTVELVDMGDVDEESKITLVRRSSSRLNKEVSLTTSSVTVDELVNQEDSEGALKTPLVRRSSSRLRNEDLLLTSSLTIDEICAPTPSTKKTSKAAVVRFAVDDDEEVEEDVGDNEKVDDKDAEDEDSPSVNDSMAEEEEMDTTSAPEGHKDDDAMEGYAKEDEVIPDTALAGPSAPAPVDPMGPNAIELVISFDTTGSMSSCIDEVRAKVQEVVQRLFMDIPNLKICIIAHGDYCDENTFYLMKKVDFTNDVATLCQFVKDVDGTGGGDFPECYEWVLRQVRNLPWTPGTQRALVMIGDAIPHEPDYPLNKLNLDWREEADKLHNENYVHIYSVECKNGGSNVTKFFKSLAQRTMGRHLKLEKFSTIVDLLMAICYREKGAEFFEAFEREVRHRDGPCISGELDDVFDTLRTPGTSKPVLTFDLSKGAAKHKNKIKPVKKVTPKKVTPKKAAPKKAAPKKAPKKTSPPVGKAKIPKPSAKKLAPPRTRVARKPRKDKRVFREKVPKTKFVLNKLKWTPWKLAMALERPDESTTTEWIQNRTKTRHAPSVGYRNANLFKDTTKGALYEIAIQKKKGGRRYVVCTTATSGFSGVHWDTYIFGKHHMFMQEIEHCMRSSYLISVRRAVLPRSCTLKVEGQKVTLKKPKDYKKLLFKLYNFAWRRQRGGGFFRRLF